MVKIGFIGAGKMAGALIRAILDSMISKSKEIIASDKSTERLAYMSDNLKIKTSNNNKDVVKSSKIIFLSVKPQNFEEVLDEIKDDIDEQLIISIAAGVTIKKMESKLGNRKIVRVMPNTPCLVGEMAAGYSLNKYVIDEDKEIVEKILNSAGTAIELEEKQLDAVTGLSGSGPAFFAYLLENFIEAGIKQGLSKDISIKLALQTMKGTAILLEKKKLATKDLIDMVSSPGGTTIAGRNILEKSDVDKVIEKTVEAAVKRSKELGK